MLAFAWIMGEELQMVSKFPEMIIFDGTELTNKEKRGLFVGTGQDGHNKIFIALHSFMLEWLEHCRDPQVLSKRSRLHDSR